MPYVDIASRGDYVSLFYRTNTVYNNVGSFNPDKPTIVMLHPLFLDSSWLQRHFDDPRLWSEYNLLAFDQRTMGRSRCRPSELHDSYVDAADIAHAMQILFVPTAHFLAFECVSVNAVLRLTALWPELVLSLTLCNVPPPTELKWVFNAYDELLQLWCWASDLDMFEHAGSEVVRFMTGEMSTTDLQDDLISYWETWTPPPKRLQIVELINIMMNRLRLSPVELASIKCPVLVIQNEQSPFAPVAHAEDLISQLVNARGNPLLYVIKGAKACMSVVPGSSSLVNQVFSKFLGTLPRARSDIVPPPMPIVERTKQALRTLAEFVGDPSIAARDPRSLLSFSRVSPEVAQSQLENLKFYLKDIEKAYCPLGRDGRPLRRYSERTESHWFHGDHHGMSKVDTAELLKVQRDHRSKSPERAVVSGQLTANGHDLVTEDIAQDGRMRRTTFNTSSVEKQVVKGSLTKVVTQSSGLKVTSGVSVPKVGLL